MNGAAADVFSSTLVVVGVLVVLRTVQLVIGGGLGLLLGALFVLAGALRLFVSRRVRG